MNWFSRYKHRTTMILQTWMPYSATNVPRQQCKLGPTLAPNRYYRPDAAPTLGKPYIAVCVIMLPQYLYHNTVYFKVTLHLYEITRHWFIYNMY